MRFPKEFVMAVALFCDMLVWFTIFAAVTAASYFLLRLLWAFGLYIFMWAGA